MSRRLLVCGGRDFSDRNLMFAVLYALKDPKLPPITTVIHGGAPGADTLAGEWAMHASIETACFAANWGLHGRAAGPIRNQEMLDLGKPTVVVAFPGGKGTRDMTSRAHKQREVVGIEHVIVVERCVGPNARWWTQPAGNPSRCPTCQKQGFHALEAT